MSFGRMSRILVAWILLAGSILSWGRSLHVIPVVNASTRRIEGRTWLLEPKVPEAWWPVGTHLIGARGRYLYLVECRNPEHPVLQTVYLMPGEVEDVVSWTGGLLAWVRAPSDGAADASWMYRLIWNGPGAPALVGPEPWRPGVFVEEAACSEGRVCFLDGGGLKPTVFLVQPGRDGWPMVIGDLPYDGYGYVLFQGDKTIIWTSSDAKQGQTTANREPQMLLEGIKIRWGSAPTSTPFEAVVTRRETIPACLMGYFKDNVEVGFASFTGTNGVFKPIPHIPMEEQITSLLTYSQNWAVDWMYFNEPAQCAFRPSPSSCPAEQDQLALTPPVWRLRGCFGGNVLYTNDRGDEMAVSLSSAFSRGGDFYAYDPPYLYLDRWTGLYMKNLAQLPLDGPLTRLDDSLAGPFLFLSDPFGLAFGHGEQWLTFRARDGKPEQIAPFGTPLTDLTNMVRNPLLELQSKDLVVLVGGDHAFAFWKDPQAGLTSLGSLVIGDFTGWGGPALSFSAEGGKTLPDDRFWVWGIAGIDRAHYGEAVLDYGQPFMPSVTDRKVEGRLKLWSLGFDDSGSGGFESEDGFYFWRALGPQGTWPRLLLAPAGLLYTVPEPSPR